MESLSLSSCCRKAVYAHTAKLEGRIINRDNLRRFFRYANSKFTHKSSVGRLQDGSGNKTIDPQVKAPLLYEYFQSQFTTDNLKLPSTIPCATDPGISSIIFSPILVKRIINKSNARSAGGPDGIPPVFFKNACSSVCHPLAFIFQLLFDDCCLPPIWRKAFITAIHKKGDTTLPSNYRPISLTCTTCKIMEAIIKDQLVSYLLSKGLISRQQHAFIKNHSTVTNLLQCTHDWALAVHGGHAVDAVYIDFARANSVVHSKLIFKLSTFGISGTC